MPIDSNKLFGPISQAIDIVTNENVRNAQRMHQSRLQTERQQSEQNRFRQQGNLQSALQMLRSGNLTPESQKAVAGSLSGILQDPNFSFQPGSFQFQKPPQFTTGQQEQDIGFEPGTQIPLDQAGPLMRRRASTKQTVPLSPNIAKTLGLPAGQEVPVEEYDSLFRAYVSKIREQRISSPLTDRELATAIDDTRQRLQNLEKIEEFNRSEDDEKEILSLRARHAELLAQQDAKVGRKGVYKPPQKAIKFIDDQLKPLREAVGKDPKNAEIYKAKVKSIYDSLVQQLGDEDKAKQTLKAALRLK